MILSTTEAEYVALLASALENIWMKEIVGDLGLCAGEVFQLSGNNQIALKTANEARLTKASMHIAIYYHFIRDKVEQGEMVLKYVPSKRQCG